MAAVTIFSDFWAQENKVCHCFHCFPIYLLWSDGTRCHDLHFWMLSFKPAFSLSTFSFIRKIFSSSSLSTIRVMLSAYLSVRGTFNCKGSNMLFSPFVCCFSRTLFLISSWKTRMSRAARSSQDWDHGKEHLLGFPSVTPFSDLLGLSILLQLVEFHSF